MTTPHGGGAAGSEERDVSEQSKGQRVRLTRDQRWLSQTVRAGRTAVVLRPHRVHTDKASVYLDDPIAIPSERYGHHYVREIVVPWEDVEPITTTPAGVGAGSGGE